MKEIISSMLNYIVLLQFIISTFSCKTFSPSIDDKEIISNIDMKNSILLRLKNKTELQLRQGEYVYVNKPLNLIFGKGRRFNYQTKKISLNTGTIYLNEIDSVTIQKVGLISYYKYLLKDSSSFIFEETKMMSVTPDYGSMFWIFFNNQDELQIIKQNEIDEILVLKPDTISTIFTIIWISASVGLIVFLVWASQFEISI